MNMNNISTDPETADNVIGGNEELISYDISVIYVDGSTETFTDVKKDNIGEYERGWLINQQAEGLGKTVINIDNVCRINFRRR